jgi:hypothetical protein
MKKRNDDDSTRGWFDTFQEEMERRWDVMRKSVGEERTSIRCKCERKISISCSWMHSLNQMYTLMHSSLVCFHPSRSSSQIRGAISNCMTKEMLVQDGNESNYDSQDDDEHVSRQDESGNKRTSRVLDLPILSWFIICKSSCSQQELFLHEQSEGLLPRLCFLGSLDFLFHLSLESHHLLSCKARRPSSISLSHDSYTTFPLSWAWLSPDSWQKSPSSDLTTETEGERLSCSLRELKIRNSFSPWSFTWWMSFCRVKREREKVLCKSKEGYTTRQISIIIIFLSWKNRKKMEVWLECWVSKTYSGGFHREYVKLFSPSLLHLVSPFRGGKNNVLV